MAETEQETKALVQDEYDDLSVEYERRWARYIARTVDETIARIDFARDDDLLDVGCGTGALLSRLRGDSGVRAGVDLSIAMASRARQHARSSAIAAADAEHLPFRDASFDVAVSTSSFHFWPQPARALAEIRRVLRPRGRLVITDWCDDFLACRVADRVLAWRNPAHLRTYRAAECERFLRDAGFDVTRLDRYKVSWLWGMMTAVARRSG